MNSMQRFKLLMKRPYEVIKQGLRALSEQEYQNQLLRTYGKDQLPTIDIIDLFEGFDGELSTYSFLDGTSLITDLLLLKKLARRYANCNYLEIGSWRGKALPTSHRIPGIVPLSTFLLMK